MDIAWKETQRPSIDWVIDVIALAKLDAWLLNFPPQEFRFQFRDKSDEPLASIVASISLKSKNDFLPYVSFIQGAIL